jgi:hypothetical protein
MLNRIANEKLVEDISKNIGVSPKYFDDFVQEIYLILLEYDQEKLEAIYEKGDINFFLTRIIKNQWCSTTSPFYRKYRKYYEYADENKNNYINMDDDGECGEDD